MLYVKYGKNRLYGFTGDVFENVDDDGRTMTDGRTMDTSLYYKLTYEPNEPSAFGSGELKIQLTQNCLIQE